MDEKNIVSDIARFILESHVAEGSLAKALEISGKSRDSQPMDVEIRRLEDRIEASQKLADARLETVMARITGSIERVEAQTNAMRQEIQGLQNDAKARQLWVMGTLIAGFLALGSLLVGVKQIWIAGVQSGQTLQQVPSGKS